MAQENTARVITIAATEQPQDIRLRVAAYARVSSSSDEQLNSFAAQNRYYTELISSKDNWQLVDIYADEGITGTSIEKRDDFKRMLRDCERGLIDRIFVKSIYESLANLNALTQATNDFSMDDIKKLGAAVTLAKPQNAEQVKNLVENLDLFDFAPGAHSPAEYGKYMIQRSGHFDYDENLDEFYDYEGYALQRMNEEDGMFTGRGYIAYKGYTSLAEIMDGSQSSHMEMGGMV